MSALLQSHEPKRTSLISEKSGEEFDVLGSIAVQAFNKAEWALSTLNSIRRSNGSHKIKNDGPY